MKRTSRATRGTLRTKTHPEIAEEAVKIDEVSVVVKDEMKVEVVVEEKPLAAEEKAMAVPVLVPEVEKKTE
ncbi:unnamed protein product, partial [Ilex paraguariensis]